MTLFWKKQLLLGATMPRRGELFRVGLMIFRCVLSTPWFFVAERCN